MSKMIFDFLDVGMGDGTLVRIPQEGKTGDWLILYDFGENKTEFDVALQDALLFLRDVINENSVARGLKEPLIDYLFISHPDADHYNRVQVLVNAPYPNFPEKKLTFKNVIVGGALNQYPQSFIDLVNQQLPAKKKVTTLPQPYTAKQPNGTFERWNFGPSVVAYPLSANICNIRSKNANSLVLMFVLGKWKVILCGDATFTTERWIMEHYDAKFLKSSAMKIGHHGSASSSSPEWAQTVRPQAIFATADTYWRHPYCKAICNYIRAGSLAASPIKETRYACGIGGSKANYYNNVTPYMICMNMWLWTTVAGDYTKEGKKSKSSEIFLGKRKREDTEVLAASVFCGVQWELELNSDNEWKLTKTDSYLPPPGTAGVAWNCETDSPFNQPAATAGAAARKTVRSQLPTAPRFRSARPR